MIPVFVDERIVGGAMEPGRHCQMTPARNRRWRNPAEWDRLTVRRGAAAFVALVHTGAVGDGDFIAALERRAGVVAQPQVALEAARLQRLVREREDRRRVRVLHRRPTRLLAA